MNAKKLLQIVSDESRDGQGGLAELVLPAVNESATLSEDQQEFVRHSLCLGIHLEGCLSSDANVTRLLAALSVATYINSCK